jgi:hypothetical protein
MSFDFSKDALLSLFKDYWILFLFLFAIICFFIYQKLSPSTKSSLKNFFSGGRFPMIAVVSVWLVWWKLPDAVFLNTHKAHIIMPIIVMVCITSSMFLQKLRYDSPQFKAPNFSGSFAKPPKEIDGFWIFAIDGIKAKGLCLPRAKRIAIVRKEPSQLMIEGAVTTAYMREIKELDIPPNVRQAILSDPDLKHAIQKSYIGFFQDMEESEIELLEAKLKELEELKNQKNPKYKGVYAMLKKELKVDSPSVEVMFYLWKNTNRAYNSLERDFNNVTRNIENRHEHKRNINDDRNISFPKETDNN